LLETCCKPGHFLHSTCLASCQTIEQVANLIDFITTWSIRCATSWQPKEVVNLSATSWKPGCQSPSFQLVSK